GRMVRNCERGVGRGVQDVDLERAVPPLWKEFDSLARMPLMVIRGVNSDLLTTATVEAMRARRQQCYAIVVPDQGHAPLLTDAETIGRITAFVAGCDS